MSDSESSFEEKLIAEQDPRARVDILNDRAWELRDIDFKESEQLCEQAEALARDQTHFSSPYTLGIAASSRTRSYIYNLRGDYPGAIRCGNHALALLEETPDLKIKNQVYRIIGFSCVQIGELDQAFRYLSEGLSIAHQMHDRRDEARFLDLIGMTYEQYGNTDESTSAYNQALSIFRELEDRRGEAVELNNLAVTLNYAKKSQDAIEAARLGLDIARSLNLAPMQPAILGTLGEAYYYLEDMDNAEQCFREALSLAMELNSRYDILCSYLILGKIALYRKDYSEAERWLLQVLPVCEETGVLKEQYECHELLSQVYETLGNFERALYHFKCYYKLNAQIWADRAETRITNLRLAMELESAKKDAEINQLKTEALQREIEERKEFQNTLEELAARDPLTGLYNRRHFFALAEQAFAQQNASGAPVSVIMFDLDHFKEVNDSYGHQIGDLVLISLAETVRKYLRKEDLICRYGGEEFVVLLPGANLSQAHQLAERLRQAVEAMEVVCPAGGIRVTISLGVIVTSAIKRHSLDELLHLVDHALYTAKHMGRNCIAAWTPE